ncbi:hypothetical protein NX059_011380 [Plenodomus lindquistii]|nr:hypothetical protein NX059_011380 [Plenodomus lindquistii]
MYLLPLALFTFLSSTLATPVPSFNLTLPSSTNTTLSLPPALLPRGGDTGLKGTCPHRHLPTEDTYTTMYNQFCWSSVPEEGANIGENVNFERTFTVQSYYKKPIKWVFRMTCELRTNAVDWHTISQKECAYAFESMLTSEYAGGLGKAYCVMGGTGGDKKGKEGMSGEGVVGMLKGKVKDPDWRPQGGKFTFEMRQMNGDKKGEH